MPGVTLIYVVLGRDPALVEQVAIEAGGAAVFARYGREADQRAVQTLPAAGYDHEGVATFFEDLLRQLARDPGLLDSCFSSHSTSQERVQNASAMIRTLNVDRARLADDTPEYQAFRARILGVGGASPGRTLSLSPERNCRVQRATKHGVVMRRPLTPG